VTVVFGDAWEPAVPVLQILALNGLRLALVRLHAYACEARGHPHAGLIVIGIQVAVGAPASIIAAHYSIVWVAVAFTVTGYAVTPLSFVFLERITGVGPLRQLAALRGILVATALMVVAVLGVQRLLDPFAAAAAVLVAAVLVGVGSYVAVISIIDRTLVTSAFRDVTRRADASS
jgi:O-antigen/teichoic acid export membrane protein